MQVTITVDMDAPGMRDIYNRPSSNALAAMLRRTADQVESEGVQWLTNTKLRNEDGNVVGQLTRTDS